MRFIGLLVIAALLGACASADHTVHVLGTPSWAQNPVAPEAMNQRIEDAAAEYAPHAPVPRLALFDIAFPSSESELKSTGGNGVLLLTALSQDKSELPPKRLYVTWRGEEHTLEQIHSAIDLPAQSPSVTEVLGPNRWDGLYLFPVRLMEDGAVLTLDFAANRTGFVFGQFSSAQREALGYDPSAAAASASDISARDAIMDLVAREYPGFVRRAP
ncbi:hypothetical protein [Lysobacter niastensis]|uniref:DUF3313 domain-containing protein n=1 Tax=Lysobacter niastensis TaxID=380629 RepID=A0ABS0B586_9GAMM|nr:hypothetical protein [Lysobacter niastensis]MBF6023966.1 hypothetical protein [Lysobacter niastensis]